MRIGMNVTQALAALSMLYAAATAVATFVSPILLPFAAARGQIVVWIVGAALALSAFAFGAIVALRKPYARKLGFLVVALAYLAAGFFGLLGVVVEEAHLGFLLWCVITAAYASVATFRLIRWPEPGSRKRPKSDLGIFISYRRDDANDTVGRIYDYLKEDFREDRLFLDVERQIAGKDFRDTIRNALDRSDVVLAIIGLRWVSIADEHGKRRLDNPADFVRQEIEAALNNSRVRIIPILVQGAKMPKVEDLPASLQPLCYLNAMATRPDPDFRMDMDRLVAALRQSELDMSAVQQQ